MRVIVETPRGASLRGYLIGRHSLPVSEGKNLEVSTVHLEDGRILTVNSKRVKEDGDEERTSRTLLYIAVAPVMFLFFFLLVDFLSYFFFSLWRVLFHG